jgi:hypothetical protein
MSIDPPKSLQSLLELRDEVREAFAGAAPGSEAVRALDAQLARIDEMIAAAHAA